MSDNNESFVTREVCDATSSTLLESQERMHRKLDNIERRLFRDNGSVSIQTRLDRHDQILRVVLWVVGIVGGAFLFACGSGLVILVRELVLRSVP